MSVDIILKYTGLNAGLCLIRSSFKNVNVIYKTISRKYSHNLHFFRFYRFQSAFTQVISFDPKNSHEERDPNLFSLETKWGSERLSSTQSHIFSKD